jgi:hypothetical protein
MAKLLSFELAREKNKLASSSVWTMLFELTIPGAPAPFRVVNYDQAINFHNQIFLPMPVEVESLEEASSASLVHLRITIENVTQQIIALLELYWHTQPRWLVRIWQIDARQPLLTPLASSEDFVIMQAKTNFMTTTFDVMAEGLTLTKTIPIRRYTVSNGFPQIPRRG